MMPNRKGFPEWMADTFHTEKNYPLTTADRFFPHQRLIRDFMQIESPYRGVLLYHGLGVGKTCASISAAEAYIAHRRRIVVMLPAALAMNYKQEIMKCASVGNPSAKLWNLVEVTVYSGKVEGAITRARAANLPKPRTKLEWIPGTVATARSMGKVIRSRVAYKDLTEEERALALDSLQQIAESAFTFVNYNGLTLKAYKELGGTAFFKDAFVIMDEAHNFISRVANGGKVALKIYEDMMQAQNLKMVLLSGTPVINHPYELSLLLNLVRGFMEVATFDMSSSAMANTNPTEGDVRHLIGAELSPYVDHVSYVPATKSLQISFVPHGYVLNSNMLLERDSDGKASRVSQIVATLQQHTGNKERPIFTRMMALPQKKQDFEELFMDNTDPEAPKLKNMTLFMRRILGLVSYVRTTGEKNFPRVVARNYEQVPMSDFQFRVYNKVRGTERKMETRRKRQMAMQVGVFGSKGTVYRAFSRMSCNFAFPDDIERKYPMDLRKEMDRVLEKEMDRIEGDDVPEEETSEPSQQSNAAKEKKLAKDYEASLKLVMKQLKDQSSQILNLTALRNVFSPKIARVVGHIAESPGKSLLYSQFRSVEGLGVVHLALEEQGYIRLEVSKKGQTWGIVNAQEVLKPQYDGKRYMIFDSDREKTKVLMQLYNGEFESLPQELAQFIKQAIVQEGDDKPRVVGRRRKEKEDNGELRFRTMKANLRGEMARVMMITQSGAEGISLKCVRRVMILEPFWNMVRMDQVIGRAVRTNSHVDLPEDERTVEVFIYTTVFTEDHLKKDFTLKRLDDGLTSDSHILRIAQNKDEVIQTFLNHMKMAAIDCRNHAASNGIFESQGIRCFAFPIPVTPSEESFYPDIDRDQMHGSRMVRKRSVQGHVVRKNGSDLRYVQVPDFPGKLFDYAAYKHAGVLQEAA